MLGVEGINDRFTDLWVYGLGGCFGLLVLVLAAAPWLEYFGIGFGLFAVLGGCGAFGVVLAKIPGDVRVIGWAMILAPILLATEVQYEVVSCDWWACSPVVLW